MLIKESIIRGMGRGESIIIEVLLSQSIERGLFGALSDR